MGLRLSTSLLAVAVLAVTAACGTSTPGDGASGEIGVVTSFYPIQFATERIAGEAVDVSVLTKPGAEPHDLEIAGQDLTRMTDASLLIYSKGFQPAVDEAAEQVDSSKILEVSEAANLTLSAAEEAGHEGESEDEHSEHAVGGNDPHFWLDPQRYAAVAEAIGARLAELDQGRATEYQGNTDAFIDELTALDKEFSTGLQSCSVEELVTSHTAFTYLAERYGFEQHGIAGISPEAEPSAAALKEITDLVKKQGVTTIYQETLVEPHFAETVASSTGAKVATLDPIEGITDASAGKDYFEVMRSNLAALREGQACS